MTWLTRRRRFLGITATAGVLFVGVAAFAAFRWQRPAPVYRPGVDLEGISSDLARSLPKDYPRVVFTDATKTAGIRFEHFSGTRSSQLPEDMGSGAAWGDYDADGWVDLVVANEVGPLTMTESERKASPARLVLYHNNHDGTFTDVTTQSGIDFRGWGMAVAWGDYDNDGHLDLVVSAYGQNHLYHNDGDGTFSDRSAVSGIGGPNGFWTGAAWGDYNRDGFLDLYVTGYVKYARPTDAGGTHDVENPASINPSSFPPARSLLFRNNGDGTFAEVAVDAGVLNTAGRGLSAAWVDFDEDGWPDLYVGNDVSNNVLYHNLGNGKFEDVSDAAHVSDYRSSMGIAVGDWDNDGFQDMFLTHWLAQENALYSNQFGQPGKSGSKSNGQSGSKSGNKRSGGASTSVPRLTFMDVADQYGLGQSTLDFVGWGTSFIDYDNDGKLDLFMVNGSTLQQRDHPTQLVPMRSQLFWNQNREEGFYEVSPVAGPYFAGVYNGRGAAFADYDNDGDVDIFVVNNGGPGVLLRNDGGNKNHWVQVELRGARSNRQGIGAKVRLVAGGVSYRRQVGAQSSYLSQNSLVETFGLGHLLRADTIEVIWPSGVRDVRTGLAANQRVQIVEGDESGKDRTRVESFWPLYREATAQRIARQTLRAADTYSRALALNPDHEDVLYYLGGTQLALGNFDGAIRAWRHLAAVNASSARADAQLGRLYSCLDAGAPSNLDSAKAHLNRAHEINKEENGPLVSLGELALMRGDLASARRYFGTVLRTHDGNAPARFYMGYIALKGADTVRARTDFLRATSASAPPPAAGVPGEGDTKKNGAASPAQRTERCDELGAIASSQPTASPADEMFRRYRRVDSLLSVARSRFR
jgi:tetratricopeptide (TPR) repeat protein